MTLFNKKTENENLKKFVFWIDKSVDKKKFTKEVISKLKTFGVTNYSINIFDFKNFFNSISKLAKISFSTYKTFGKFFVETKIKDDNTFNIIILEKNHKYCNEDEFSDYKSGIISIFYPFIVEWFNNFTPHQKSHYDLILSIINRTYKLSNDNSSNNCNCNGGCHCKDKSNKSTSSRRKNKK